MSSNIKALLVILLLPLVSGWAQEVENEEEGFTSDPETVFFNLEVFRPVGLGSSSFARDYSLTPGFAFDFNYFVLPEFTIGTHFSVFGSSVENPQRIGNISNTMIYLFGVDVGYYYQFDRHWNIHATTGIGSVQYTSEAPEDRFHEQGVAYWFQVQVGYRFNKTVGVYFKMNPRLDKLRIQTPQHLDDYFNRHLYINPGFGLRLNLQNPGG